MGTHIYQVLCLILSFIHSQSPPCDIFEVRCIWPGVDVGTKMKIADTTMRWAAMDQEKVTNATYILNMVCHLR